MTQQISPSTTRRFAALLGLAAIVGCGILAATLRRTAPLPPGAPFPDLDTVDWWTGVPRPLGPDGRPTVLVLIHSQCHYCAEQMASMSARHESLLGARIVLVTGETKPPADYAARWPRYAADSAVAWLRAPAHQLSAALRTSATPSTFVFDAGGRLYRSFRGLTGADAIEHAVAAASAPPDAASVSR